VFLTQLELCTAVDNFLVLRSCRAEKSNSFFSYVEKMTLKSAARSFPAAKEKISVGRGGKQIAIDRGAFYSFAFVIVEQLAAF